MASSAGTRSRDAVGRGLAAHAARLHVLLERALTAALDEHGMTRAEFDVLAALVGSDDGLRPKQLSSRLLLTTGGMSNVLRRLEAAGLVTRVASDDDGRGQSVHLTRAGARAVRAADEQVEQTIRSMLVPVPHGTLAAGLRALHDTLDAMGEDGPVHRPAPGARPS